MFICEKDMHCVEMDCPIHNPEETCDHMIEVEPVKYGGWTIHDPDWNSWTCTNCKEAWILNDGDPIANNMRYCPHCGAKCLSDDDFCATIR